MLVAIGVSSLCGYLDDRNTIFLCVGYVVLSFFFPGFLVFLPLLVYDCVDQKAWREDKYGSAFFINHLLRFCWVIALPIGFLRETPQTAIAVLLTSAAALLLQHRTNAQITGRDELFAMRDNAKERAEQLEQTNRSLLEKQDYEVRLATLAERNRIAREIHDNVGHMLTRSLLQISALRVSNADDEKLTSELDMVKGTLSDAMDSIRSSIHDLHDESIDLKSRLDAMIDGFLACPVKLRYDAGDLPVDVKICFTAVVREALSNIAKHSSATEARVTVMEHPSFYQLVVSDNGIGKKSGGQVGIGLQSMADRVDALRGVFRAESDKGFKIFISIPKVSEKGVVL